MLLDKERWGALCFFSSLCFFYGLFVCLSERKEEIPFIVPCASESLDTKYLLTSRNEICSVVDSLADASLFSCFGGYDDFSYMFSPMENIDDDKDKGDFGFFEGSRRFVFPPRTEYRVILTSLGMSEEDIGSIIKKLVKLASSRIAPSKTPFFVDYQRGGGIQSIRFQLSPTHVFLIQRLETGEFSVALEPVVLQKKMFRVTGYINESLYASLKSQKIPKKMIKDILKAFSYVVNLQHGLRSGDPFEVLYEAQVDSNHNFVLKGDVFYVALGTRNQVFQMYRFQSSDGSVSFYDDRGESVQRSFLKTPIDPSKMRISSHFQGNRFHPIKGYCRAHKGVDFAATRGTRVVASGDGVIEQASYSGGYGNVVRIRHGAGYETVYAHLSSFAQGVRPGQRVRQGDVIGYVGATGLATGPHLHYEVICNRQHVNPLSIKQLSARRLEFKELKKFQLHKNSMNQRVVGIHRLLAAKKTVKG